jgi:acetolactate synthase I/II/III large subunit
VRVSEAVGRALVRAGIDHVFGVVGSGNFHVTNAMVAEGARFVAARHEGGATTMADAYARVSGRVAAVTVHQGCGLTNAITGLAEAAKSRTPLVVVAAEATEPRSNFHVDQPALAAAVGAVSLRVDRAEEAVTRAVEAVTLAVTERRTVLLNLPLSVQAGEVTEPGPVGRVSAPVGTAAEAADVERLADAVRAAERPVFVAGRGGRTFGAELREVAARSGALLAESAVAKDLFGRREPWSLGVSGGFASPVAAELIGAADLIVGWGCALNMWTMRHGRLIADGATVVQVDDTADALQRRLAAGPVQWRQAAYDDPTGDGLIDPRTLTTVLDDLLPAERIVSVDSGNFMGYPAMFLDTPDEQGFCFTQAFQSIGLGLATAVGAALARPDRLPVAALGDGGALMSAAELETVVRLGLPMLVVVYDDHAYGAEVHHFGPDGEPLDTVVFPDTDLAAIARGYGFEAVTVREVADLAAVGAWLDRGPTGPMLVDAKVVDSEPSWWLDEAFRGH